MIQLPRESDRDELKAQWLTRVRWGAIAAWGAIGLSSAWVFDLTLTLTPLAVFLTITILSNLVLSSRALRVVPPFTRMATTILVDIALLSGLLFCYGGYTNPFSTMFLVYVTLSAFLLNARWTWWAFVFSGAAFSALFFFHLPLDGFEVHHHGDGGFSLHLSGMLAAFFVIGFLLSLFLTAMSRELDQQAEQIRLLEDKRLREEKFLSVATLAAGAAHELSTPIATLSLICEDLTAALRDDVRWGADVRLMHDQLKRCDGILRRMRGEEFQVYPTVKSTPAEVVARIQDAFPGSVISTAVSGEAFLMETQPFVEAAQSLVKNALQAATGESGVSVNLSHEKELVTLEVIDRGAGMEKQVLDRAGEPFFTTKPPGDGLGLGLFLVRSYAVRAGGEFQIFSSPGNGTRVVISVPTIAASVEMAA